MGLVEDLDGDDHVLRAPGGELLGDDLEHGVRLGDGVALAPAGGRRLAAAVVEAVLRAGRAVQVDDDFEAGLAGPGEGFVEIGR